MFSLIYAAIVGLISGFLANYVMKGKSSGLLINLLVGVGGGLLGGWVFSLLGIEFGNGLIGSVLTGFLGALLLLFIVNKLKK